MVHQQLLKSEGKPPKVVVKEKMVPIKIEVKKTPAKEAPKKMIKKVVKKKRK